METLTEEEKIQIYDSILKRLTVELKLIESLVDTNIVNLRKGLAEQGITISEADSYILSSFQALTFPPEIFASILAGFALRIYPIEKYKTLHELPPFQCLIDCLAFLMEYIKAFNYGTILMLADKDIKNFDINVSEGVLRGKDMMMRYWQMIQNFTLFSNIPLREKIQKSTESVKLDVVDHSSSNVEVVPVHVEVEVEAEKLD